MLLLILVMDRNTINSIDCNPVESYFPYLESSFVHSLCLLRKFVRYSQKNHISFRTPTFHRSSGTILFFLLCKTYKRKSFSAIFQNQHENRIPLKNALMNTPINRLFYSVPVGICYRSLFTATFIFIFILILCTFCWLAASRHRMWFGY